MAVNVSQFANPRNGLPVRAKRRIPRSVDPVLDGVGCSLITSLLEVYNDHHRL